LVKNSQKHANIIKVWQHQLKKETKNYAKHQNTAVIIMNAL
jgi:hypothetical protein